MWVAERVDLAFAEVATQGRALEHVVTHRATIVALVVVRLTAADTLRRDGRHEVAVRQVYDSNLARGAGEGVHESEACPHSLEAGATALHLLLLRDYSCILVVQL